MFSSAVVFTMTVLVLQTASTRAGIVAFNSWNTHSKTCRRHLIREWLEAGFFMLLLFKLNGDVPAS